MKCLILTLCLLVVTPACSPPVTIVTPAGKVAYSADLIVIRVNELMNAAIAAQANGGLPTNTARTIVQFCVSADQTLAATPAGWQATLLQGWTSAKAQLPTISNPTILALMGAVDVAIGGVQ